MKKWLLVLLIMFMSVDLNAGVTEKKRPTIYREYFGVPDGSVAQMFLDGVEVTSKCSITPTRIEYIPDEDLSIGEHTVRVEVTTPEGKIHKVEWNFTVDPNAKVAKPKVKFLSPTPKNNSKLPFGATLDINLELSDDKGIDLKNIMILVMRGKKILHKVKKFQMQVTEGSLEAATKVSITVVNLALDPGRIMVKVIAQDLDKNPIEDAWVSFIVKPKKLSVEAFNVNLVEKGNVGLNVSGTATSKRVQITVKGEASEYTVSVAAGGRFDYLIQKKYLPPADRWHIVARDGEDFLLQDIACPKSWTKLKIVESKKEKIDKAKINKAKFSSSKLLSIKRLPDLLPAAPVLLEGKAPKASSLYLKLSNGDSQTFTADDKGHFKQWLRLKREGKLTGILFLKGSEEKLSFEITVDASAPQIQNVTVNGARLSDNRQELVFKIKDSISGWKKKKIELKLDGKSWRPKLRKSGDQLNVSLTHLKKVGKHVVEITAEDLVGNRSTALRLSFEIKDLVRGLGAKILEKEKKEKEKKEKEKKVKKEKEKKKKEEKEKKDKEKN